MARTLKIVHVGLGPIGQSIARLTLERDALQVVGATDLSTDQAGKDLGLVLGLGRRLRLKVDGSPERFIRKARADVAVLCTSSSIKAIKPQVLALVLCQEAIDLLEVAMVDEVVGVDERHPVARDVREP